jgi:uncharacterized protein YecE (DUF72 family)
MSDIYFGTAGWSYKDWEGTVYPDNIEANFDQLTYISTYFDVVELNTTFYNPPSIYMSRSWVKKTSNNPNFKFTAKLWQKFTHERGTVLKEEEKAFKDGIAPLMENGKLGALLIQFPWSFKNNSENRKVIESISDRLREYPLVIEFRHNSWLKNEILFFLRDNNIGFCNIDQPVIGESIKPTNFVTSEIGYIRLHGRNYKDWFRKEAGRDDRYNYLYSSSELEEWVQKIKKMKDKMHCN